MSNYQQVHDSIAFHPGYYIKEFMESIKISEEDFAKQLNISKNKLLLILNGKQNITINLAEKLSKITKISTKCWLNLQESYDKIIIKTDK